MDAFHLFFNIMQLCYVVGVGDSIADNAADVRVDREKQQTAFNSQPLGVPLFYRGATTAAPTVLRPRHAAPLVILPTSDVPLLRSIVLSPPHVDASYDDTTLHVSRTRSSRSHQSHASSSSSSSSSVDETSAQLDSARRKLQHVKMRTAMPDRLQRRESSDSAKNKDESQAGGDANSRDTASFDSSPDGAASSYDESLGGDDAPASTGAAATPGAVAGAAKWTHDDTSRFLDEVERRRQAATTAGNDCSATAVHVVERLPDEFYATFSSLADHAVNVANILNLLARVTGGGGGPTLRSGGGGESTFFSIARALVDSHDQLYSASIAFLPADATDPSAGPPPPSPPRGFAPSVFRNRTSNRLVAKDSSVEATPRFGGDDFPSVEWFARTTQRGNWTALGSAPTAARKDVCERVSSSDERLFVLNVSSVVSRVGDGTWSQPYFACLSANTWLITYSAPFFTCNTGRTLALQ